MNCPKCGHLTSDHQTEYSSGGKFQCWERRSHDNNDFCGCTHGKPEPASLKLYAVRNSAGQWFRGRYPHGNAWVSDIQKAKLYAKIGQARGRVSFFANLRPDLPTPELVEFAVTESGVIDESERVAGVRKRKAEQVERRRVNEAEWQRKEAEAAIAKATATLARLGGRES